MAAAPSDPRILLRLFGLEPSRGASLSAPFGSFEGSPPQDRSRVPSRTPPTLSTFSPARSRETRGRHHHPSGRSPRRLAEAPPRLRIASPRLRPSTSPSSGVHRRGYSSGALVADLGHDVREATPPWVSWSCSTPSSRSGRSAWRLIRSRTLVADDAGSRAHRGVARGVRGQLSTRGRVAADLSRRIVAFWNDVDVLLRHPSLLPPVPIGWQEPGGGAIEPLLRNTEFTPFTAMAKLTGLPAMSLPLHWSKGGLPIGVQSMGPPARDALPLVRRTDRGGTAMGGPASDHVLARDHDADLLPGRDVNMRAALPRRSRATCSCSCPRRGSRRPGARPRTSLP